MEVKVLNMFDHPNVGGPVVLSQDGAATNPPIQVGIVSWIIKNEGCVGSSYPGVYTSVSEVACWVLNTVCAKKRRTVMPIQAVEQLLLILLPPP